MIKPVLAGGVFTAWLDPQRSGAYARNDNYSVSAPFLKICGVAAVIKMNRILPFPDVATCLRGLTMSVFRDWVDCR